MCTYIYLRCHGVCMKNHRLSRQGTRTTVWMCYAQFSLIRLVKYMQCSKCMYVWHYASAQDNKQWQHFNLSDLQWREWVMICFVYVCVFLYLQCVCVCVCVCVCEWVSEWVSESVRMRARACVCVSVTPHAVIASWDSAEWKTKPLTEQGRTAQWRNKPGQRYALTDCQHSLQLIRRCQQHPVVKTLDSRFIN